MLLAAVTTIAAPGVAVVATTNACNTTHATGFSGETAYEADSEPPGTFGDANDASATTDGTADGGSDADAAAEDAANDAGDGGG